MDFFGNDFGEELWARATPLDTDDPTTATVSMTVSLWELCDVVDKTQYKEQLGDGLSEHLLEYLQEKVCMIVMNFRRVWCIREFFSFFQKHVLNGLSL